MNLIGKRILVTGASGLIGRQLVSLLKEEGCAKLTTVSLELFHDNDVEHHQVDLRELSECRKVLKSQEIVFHVAGVKGSPKLTKSHPYTFFYNTMAFSTNVIHASYEEGVEWLLNTSSVGVYAPASVFYEKDMWSSPPSNNDKFAGYAKRMGELQLEALNEQYGWSNATSIRPSNVYGPFDNFDPETAMVIPSLVARAASGENPLKVWGDGTAVRDFVHARDVARAMIFAVKREIKGAVNVGAGQGVSIRAVVSILQKLIPNLQVEWVPSGPSGDNVRVMDTTMLTNEGFKNLVSLHDGVAETYNWFVKFHDNLPYRYDPFGSTTRDYGA